MILACHRPFKQSPVYANSLTCSESVQEWVTVKSLVNEVILQSSEFGMENNALRPLSFQTWEKYFLKYGYNLSPHSIVVFWIRWVNSAIILFS